MPRRKDTKHSVATGAKAAAVSSKAVWAALSPEERASRVAKMRAGRKYGGLSRKVVSVALKSYWQGRDDADRKAVGAQLAASRARWKKENPQEWAAMEARRIAAVRRYHANITPEQKQARIEKSARGKILKAQARIEACPKVQWKPDASRLDTFLERILEDQ